MLQQYHEANEDLIVNYTISGTAINGVDYETLSSNVVILAGATNATITVMPMGDLDITEGNETVILTLAPGGYGIGVANSATVTILPTSRDQWRYKLQITFSGYSPPDGTFWP